MKLDVVRFQFGADATNSLLFIDGEFECYGLEDEYRDVKVMHETCIPEGEYEIKLRTEGGFHTRYAAKYGDWHEGMLWLQDVPVGETQTDLDKGKDGFVGNSGVAYKKMYPKVKDAILAGEKVTIKYSNIKDMLNIDDLELQISDLRGQVKILESEKKGRYIR